MANRALARADDNPGEILEDGELHKTGMWDEITIERSAAGAPGLMFVMTRYENSMMFDQMCVTVPDGSTFLHPVMEWLGMEPYSVVSSMGERYSENIVGTYQSRFDAEAVAARWNKVNNKHGITYRVEEGY